MNHEQRNQFFMTFFENKEGKEVKEVNGFILFKHWDGNVKKWVVGLFTPDSFQRMNDGFEKFNEFKNQQKLL